MPSERRPGRWSRLLRLLLAGAVLVAGAACESGRVKRPEVATTTTPAGPMVERYLTDALNLIQQHAFYAGRVDWPAARAEAGRRTADATTTAGTYDTIRWVHRGPDVSETESLGNVSAELACRRSPG